MSIMKDNSVEENQDYFHEIVQTFANYGVYARYDLQQKYKNFQKLSNKDKKWLPSNFEQKYASVSQCITCNETFLRRLLSCTVEPWHRSIDDFFSNGSTQVDQMQKASISSSKSLVKEPNSPSQQIRQNQDKVRSVLRQFVRDWSSLGNMERLHQYKPIEDALLKEFGGKNAMHLEKVQVLVPGAGLGRLAYNIASHGMSCQGNENSYFMLLASEYALNHFGVMNKPQTIFPWISSWSNIAQHKDMVMPVQIPDAAPVPLNPQVDFSMVAGSFEDVYAQSNHIGRWNAVVTCFFLDTAHNVIEYIHLIHQILKTDGIWINIGPLLYHWESDPNNMSIELSLAEVKQVSKNVGFQFEQEKMVECTYDSHMESMLTSIYKSAFWIARKH